MTIPIFVKHNRIFKRVNPEDVVYLTSEKNYTTIFVNDGKYYVQRSTLAAVLAKLPERLFAKIDRSVATSVLYMDEVHRDHVIVCGEPFRMGKNFYKTVLEQLTTIE